MATTAKKRIVPKTNSKKSKRKFEKRMLENYRVLSLVKE
jgi:hypothetical protein